MGYAVADLYCDSDIARLYTLPDDESPEGAKMPKRLIGVVMTLVDVEWRRRGDQQSSFSTLEDGLAETHTLLHFLAKQTARSSDAARSAQPILLGHRGFGCDALVLLQQALLSLRVRHEVDIKTPVHHACLFTSAEFFSFVIVVLHDAAACASRK